mgnify:FL=1|tara:strand:- start:7 stop:1332 length:1326 start_codon:yes stop_codon:yes gene_type:complete
MGIVTPVTIGHLDNILKDFYIGPLQEQLNNEVMVLEMFEKAKISWAGKRGVVPVHIGRNSGVAFRAEDAGLKAAGSQDTKRLTFSAAYLYGRFEVTGPAIAAAAKGGTASFIGALELEMDKLKEDIRNTADKTAVSGGIVAGFLNEKDKKTTGWEFRGDFDKLATALGFPDAPADVDVQIINCANQTLQPAATTCYEVVANKTIESDTFLAQSALGKIDFTTELDTEAGGTHEVTSGFAAAVVISEAAPKAALETEPVGIYGNLASELHFGVDRGQAAGDATPLQSVIMTMSETGKEVAIDLTLSRMQEVIDSITSLSGMEPNIIMMNPFDRAKYIHLCQENLQITRTGAAGQGDAGFLGLSYGGIPIKAARHVGRGLMLFLNTKDWKLAVLEDGKFADLDGSVLSRVQNKDSFEGFYKWYYNHYCCRPNANGILTGLKFS